MKKLNKYLLGINCFLIILLIFSFFKNPSKENRKAIKTALLNSKYKDSIYEINIKSSYDEIELNKDISGYWVISKKDNPENKILCNQKKIDDFITSMQNITKIYQVSDKLKSVESITKNDWQILSYTYLDDQKQSHSTNLIFGDYDFSKTERYFYNLNTTALYEISTEFDKFLTGGVQNWSNPNLFPKIDNFDFNDLQRVIVIDKDTKVISPKSENWNIYSNKAFELYHAGLCENESIDLILQLIFEFGNNSYMQIQFFLTQGDEYNCQTTYFSSDNNELFTQSSKISGWTLSQLK